MKPGDVQEMLVTARVKALYFKEMKAKLERQHERKVERLPEKNQSSAYISVEGPALKLEPPSPSHSKREIQIASDSE